MTDFPQQGHTYSNQATPPNMVTSFGGRFLSNHPPTALFPSPTFSFPVCTLKLHYYLCFSHKSLTSIFVSLDFVPTLSIDIIRHFLYPILGFENWLTVSVFTDILSSEISQAHKIISLSLATKKPKDLPFFGFELIMELSGRGHVAVLKVDIDIHTGPG